MECQYVKVDLPLLTDVDTTMRSGTYKISDPKNTKGVPPIDSIYGNILDIWFEDISGNRLQYIKWVEEPKEVMGYVNKDDCVIRIYKRIFDSNCVNHGLWYEVALGGRDTINNTLSPYTNLNEMKILGHYIVDRSSLVDSVEKATITIELPKGCYYCPLMHMEYQLPWCKGIFNHGAKQIDDLGVRQSFCPLEIVS